MPRNAVIPSDVGVWQLCVTIEQFELDISAQGDFCIHFVYSSIFGSSYYSFYHYFSFIFFQCFIFAKKTFSSSFDQVK